MAFILTPPPPLPSRGAAERRRRSFFFAGGGTPWTRMFRQAGHTHPHQRFARWDENYLVGEPVLRVGGLLYVGCAAPEREKAWLKSRSLYVAEL